MTRGGTTSLFMCVTRSRIYASCLTATSAACLTSHSSRQIRVGDIALLAEDKGGPTFFTNLKQELDVVLSTLFPVHYYFFAEVPANATTSESQITPPPPGFEFLSEIFQDQDEKGNVGGNEKDQRGSTQHLQRVSFISHMDAKATLYHQMNADMVITTGSSFPLVGVTVSPKVRRRKHLGRSLE